MIERVLEPEVMDDPDESEAYDQMDHSEVNRVFVDDLLSSGVVGTDILDLGTGTAQIPIELCERKEECRVMASDAAVSMLEIARLNIAVAGFEHRIELHHGDSKELQFDDDIFDSLLSNSLLHHIPEPLCVIKEMGRILKPGGKIFVRDLMRPKNLATVESFVESYAGQESAACQQLFRQSLIAALTLDEIKELLSQAGYNADGVQATSDRHWTWAAVL